MLLTFWGTRGSIPAPINPDQVEQKIFFALRTAGEQKIDLANPVALESFVKGLSLEGSTIGGNTTCVTIDSSRTTPRTHCTSGSPFGL